MLVQAYLRLCRKKHHLFALSIVLLNCLHKVIVLGAVAIEQAARAARLK